MNKLILSAITGLGFSGAALGIAKVFGLSSNTFTAVLYLFPTLGITLWILDNREKLKPSVSERFLFLADEERKVLRQVFTGKKYRVEGELEEV